MELVKLVQDSTNTPKEKDLRLTHFFHKNGVKEIHTYRVKDINDALNGYTKLAEEQLKDDDVDWNSFMLEVYEENEWCEWLDENCNSFEEVARGED